MKTIARRLLLGLLACALCAAPALAQFQDQRNYGGTSGGAANAQTLTIANMPAVVPAGVPIRFIPGSANTGAATLTISGGSGAVALCKPSPSGPTALTGGELQTTQVTEIVSNGTCYLITSSVDSTATSISPPPQGRLTLSTGIPVMTGNVSAATTAYYTPYVGNQLPIYNGSRFVIFAFPELTLTIPSSRLANLLYDACVFSDGGTPTVVLGPAWSNSGAGAGDRGSGAGTPELTRINGILVNAVSISGVNGGATHSIDANLCTYVGTMHMDGTNGQVSFLSAYGQNRKTGIWNYYNRVPVVLKAGDSTASWTYAGSAFQAQNANAANKITTFFGFAEEQPAFTISQVFSNISAEMNIGGVAVGKNSTTTAGGFTAQYRWLPTMPIGALIGSYTDAPTLGINNFQMLERSNGTTTITFAGGEANNLMTGTWRY